jgi:Phage capsid family
MQGWIEVGKQTKFPIFLKGSTMSDTVMKALNGALDKIETNNAEIRDRLLQLEQRGSARSEGVTAGGDTIGDRFIKSFSENAEMFAKTKSLRLEIKAATDPITTTSGRRILVGGSMPPNGNLIGIQFGLPQRSTPAVTAFEYSRYTGVQGAAAVQAVEGDAKAAVRPDHSIVTQNAITIAGYSKISKQTMNDMAELKTAIDITLMRSVNTVMDATLCAGTTGFTGGILGLATAFTSATYQRLVDATSEGVAFMQTAGFMPDVVVLSPNDWLAISVAQNTTGDYLSGSYLSLPGENLRGLRVVLSPGMTAGKSLILDSQFLELLIVDTFAVEAGFVDQDFTKNLVTLLGETRVIPTFRSVGAARLITKAP